MHAFSATKPALSDEMIIQDYFVAKPGYCFELLYNRYSQKVMRRCLSMTKDAELAQDYTHDIFIRMFSKLDKFQGKSSFSTWLYTIASNYVLDQLRLSKRLPTAEMNDEFDYPTYRSDDTAELLESSLTQLGNAMSTISSQDAQILRLKYQEGLDVRQIGLRLHIQESAVKMRLKRSRDRVRSLCNLAS